MRSHATGLAVGGPVVAASRALSGPAPRRVKYPVISLRGESAADLLALRRECFVQKAPHLLQPPQLVRRGDRAKGAQLLDRIGM